jgi:hypothetical protein
LLALLGAHHILHVSRIRVKAAGTIALQVKSPNFEVRETSPLCVTNIIKIKRNRRFISQDGVRLSNYMFRPDFVAIVRLQSSAVKSYTKCLKVG